MIWMIVGGAVLATGLLVWNSRRPKTFTYRGKSYTRHSDGSFTYVDGGSLDDDERNDVSDYWDSSHDSSSSDSSDGGGDGGGGGGD